MDQYNLYNTEYNNYSDYSDEEEYENNDFYNNDVNVMWENYLEQEEKREKNIKNPAPNRFTILHNQKLAREKQKKQRLEKEQIKEQEKEQIREQIREQENKRKEQEINDWIIDNGVSENLRKELLSFPLNEQYEEVRRQKDPVYAKREKERITRKQDQKQEEKRKQEKIIKDRERRSRNAWKERLREKQRLGTKINSDKNRLNKEKTVRKRFRQPEDFDFDNSYQLHTGTLLMGKRATRSYKNKQKKEQFISKTVNTVLHPLSGTDEDEEEMNPIFMTKITQSIFPEIPKTKVEIKIKPKIKQKFDEDLEYLASLVKNSVKNSVKNYKKRKRNNSPVGTSVPEKGWETVRQKNRNRKRQKKEPRTNPTKTTPCRNILNGGTCPYGDRCHFSHVIKKIEPETAPVAPWAKLKRKKFIKTATLDMEVGLPLIHTFKNSLHNNRTRGFTDLAKYSTMDKKEQEIALLNTRLCHSVIYGTKCKYGPRCRFAHSIKDLSHKPCSFVDNNGRSTCRRVEMIQTKIYENKGDRICQCWHPEESDESYLARIVNKPKNL